MQIALKTVGVVAQDMDATLKFYGLLGLPVPERSAGEPNVEMVLPSGLVLGFLTEQMAQASDPRYQSATGSSLNLQFECADASEVDAVYDRMIAGGYEGYAAPWDAFWGQRFARITDPDGRVVNVYATL